MAPPALLASTASAEAATPRPSGPLSAAPAPAETPADSANRADLANRADRANPADPASSAGPASRRGWAHRARVARADLTQRGAHARYLATSRFESLDGLRCLAILPVIWHHSTPRPLPGLLGRGPLGVHLFFALSGFLITARLVRERRVAGTVSLSAFYARRALRIFPLYYLVLGLYAARGYWLLPASAMRSHFLGNLPYFATYTSNWLVDWAVPHPVIFAFSWSLATEEQFYLVWPWLFRGTRGLLLPAAGSMVLLGLDHAAEAGALRPLLGAGLGHAVVTSISAPICLGALLACALEVRAAHRLLHGVLGRAVSAPLALTALGALVAGDTAPLWAIHLALVALVGSVCVRADHGLRWLLELAPLRWVGSVSYGAYLFHVAAITLVRSLLPAPSAPLVFVLASGLTLALAGLSMRHFERRWLALGQRFRAPGTDDDASNSARRGAMKCA